METRPTEYYGIRVHKEYLNFSAAHFVIFGPGQREALHGHNYYISVEIDGLLTEQRDLFIDFCDIKPILRKIGDSLDHKVLLQGTHPDLQFEEDEQTLKLTYRDADCFVFPRTDVIVLPISNTTAELLAQYVYGKMIDALCQDYGGAAVLSVSVSVEETSGQAAKYVQRFEAARQLSTLRVPS